MQNYNYNYGRSLSNYYIDQTNSYQLMDTETIHRRATTERLGDTGYDCPPYDHRCENSDTCYNYRLSLPTPNYQSPTAEYPFGGDLGISNLHLAEAETSGAGPHSSSMEALLSIPAPSSPENMQIPLSPWTTYSDDEYTRNFGGTHDQYTPYGELQGVTTGTMDSQYFQSPRSVRDNITNLGFRPHYSPDLDGITTTTICDTPGKVQIKKENHSTPIKEEKGSEIDQNKNVDVRAAGLPSTPGRRYKCTVRGCSLHFKRRAEMDRHKESVHQPSPGHLCPVPGCNRGVLDNGFSRKDNLRQHLKLKHEYKFPKGRRSRRT